jgi:hypothetical protein
VTMAAAQIDAAMIARRFARELTGAGSGPAAGCAGLAECVARSTPSRRRERLPSAPSR